MSLSVAVAPTSPFSSETSATTSIGSVVSVCGGALTAVTTRSGRRQGDRGAPELDEVSRSCRSGRAPSALTVRSPGDRPEVDLGDARRARRRPAARRIVAPFTETWTYFSVSTAGSWRLGVDLDPEQPALRSRERADLKRIRSRDGGAPSRGHGERERSRTPTAHASQAPRLPHRPNQQPAHLVSFVVSLTRRGCARQLTRRSPATNA